MTRQQLIDGIIELDPSFASFVDWDNHTDEALQMTYDRKNNAPQAIKDRMKNRGNRSSYVPQTRNAFIDDDIPVQKAKEDNSVALTGFDALKKE